MDIFSAPRSTSSLLEVVGISGILAAVLGLSIPVLDNVIVIPPTRGPVLRWIELGLGVLFLVIGLALQHERSKNPLALVTSRAILSIVTLFSLNTLAWLSQCAPLNPPRLVPPSRMVGDWKGPWNSPVDRGDQAELLLRTYPAGTSHLTGTLSVTYLNGWCAFELAGTSTATDQAELKITAINAGSDRCQAGLGDHLVLQRLPDPQRELLSVVEVAGADSAKTLFQGDLLRTTSGAARAREVVKAS
jgi:hypothetical protein